jgi:hypothetical protein
MLLRFYVMCRWARLTIRRYGAAYLVIRYRPRHAGVGRADREQAWGRAHGDSTGWNVTTQEIVTMLERERERECALS